MKFSLMLNRFPPRLFFHYSEHVCLLSVCLWGSTLEESALIASEPSVEWFLKLGVRLRSGIKLH